MNLIPEVPTRAVTAAVLKYLRAEGEETEAALYELVRNHPRITNDEIERELGQIAIELIGDMVDSGLLVSEGFSNWPNERRLLSVAAPWVETLRRNGIRVAGGRWTTMQYFPEPFYPDSESWEPGA